MRIATIFQKNLPIGLYHVLINDKNGNTQTLKLIKELVL